jgi:hypothetical protein
MRNQSDTGVTRATSGGDQRSVSLSVEPSRAGPIRSARQEGLGHLNAEFIPSQASNNALAQARTGYGHMIDPQKMPFTRHSPVAADPMPTGAPVKQASRLA